MIDRFTLLVQANTWLGTPYEWGGTGQGVSGVDCSGFVLAVFLELNLPFLHGVRTAEQIRQVCQPIQLHEALPGDLFFLEKTYEHPETIDQWGPDGRIATHIGFVRLEGSIETVLDANSARGNVGVSHWNPWWDDHFIEIRRPPQLLAETVPEPEPAPEPEPELERTPAEVASFIGNFLAPDGEVQTALTGIHNSLQSDWGLDDARQETEALISRIEALWHEWTGV